MRAAPLLAAVAVSLSACGPGEAAGTGPGVEPAAVPGAEAKKADDGGGKGKGKAKHIIVVMMENRSFDHFLGWLPGADGRQAGLSYPDRAGVLHPTHELAPDYQGCGHPDPDHSYTGGRIEYDGGACDGWLRAGANDDYSIGYYTQPDLSFFGAAAPAWTVMDRYYAAILAETYPNRIYMHAAQTDRITNTTTISTLPTIWDRLAAAGKDGRYYYSDVPFLALWGPKYLPISHPIGQFLVDASTGNLPDVAFVDPRFEDEESGTSGDDHPHSDIRNGETFLALLYAAVTRGPAWKDTVMVINYDEWGGFFDHVPPPTAPIPPATAAAGDTDGRLGFRVANLLVSPWARRGYVAHEQFDHTSVLKFIETNFGLQPLTVRDATANNLGDALDFSRRQLAAPAIPFAPVVYGGVCGPAGTPQVPGDLEALRQLAVDAGYRIYGR